MEIAYKAFRKGLIATMGKGKYQYKTGIWLKEQDANCAKNGFHAAKNILDCFNYYSMDLRNTEVHRVLIKGDIDEDDRDSKVACTEIFIFPQALALDEICAYAIEYMYQHPTLETNKRVEHEKGKASGGFVIVRGKSPLAMGKDGDVLALAREDEQGNIVEYGVFTVGKNGIRPDTWTDVKGCHN